MAKAEVALPTRRYDKTLAVDAVTGALQHRIADGISGRPIAPLPFGDNQATLLLANMFIVPASCKSVDLANEFIATALRSDVQETMSRTASQQNTAALII